MTLVKIATLILCFGSAINGLSKDVFPEFSNKPFVVSVPTNTPGVLIDKSSLVGTNYIYKLNGQSFIGGGGSIQSPVEGFSGITDKSTPWKTLTELLKVYQNGSPSDEILKLYDSSSKESISGIYANEKIKARLENIGRSMLSMRVICGFDFEGGYLAFVGIENKDGNKSVTPFYFVLDQGKYKLSALKLQKPSLNFMNVGAFARVGFTSKP